MQSTARAALASPPPARRCPAPSPIWDIRFCRSAATRRQIPPCISTGESESPPCWRCFEKSGTGQSFPSWFTPDIREFCAQSPGDPFRVSAAPAGASPPLLRHWRSGAPLRFLSPTSSSTMCWEMWSAAALRCPSERAMRIRFSSSHPARTCPSTRRPTSPWRWKTSGSGAMRPSAA